MTLRCRSSVLAEGPSLPGERPPWAPCWKAATRFLFHEEILFVRPFCEEHFAGRSGRGREVSYEEALIILVMTG